MGVSVSSRHSTATTATSSEPPWKKYRPSRAPQRLAHVFSERNIAPARSKWAKYSTFQRAGAKNISRHPTAPHAGAVFLSPQSHPYPTGGTQLTLLGSISAHARNSSPSVLYFCCGVRKSSPCKPKRAKNAVFRRAGRVFSRRCRWRGRVGRVFSRRGTGSWAHLLPPPLMHG